jgi:type IV secretory pathway VirB9-like protein
MPTATRTFRVFVSSTFEDLKAERDALQRHVFPRLRTLCEANNARFQAIDLRWGVRDEAALDQQTLEICLREIERCQQTGIKPNFIVLLGDESQARHADLARHFFAKPAARLRGPHGCGKFRGAVGRWQACRLRCG